MANFVGPGGWQYIAGESVLILLFTYFYTAVTFNPVLGCVTAHWVTRSIGG